MRRSKNDEKLIEFLIFINHNMPKSDVKESNSHHGFHLMRYQYSGFFFFAQTEPLTHTILVYVKCILSILLQ